MTTNVDFRHVTYAWDERRASERTPLERLVYRSNLLGADQRITNTGGGNTSAKVRETDPLTGESVEVLWVKGSGGDLRTAQPDNFASLYLQRLLDLRELYARQPERGPKTPAEDAMVGYFSHCTFGLNPRASSIDTPLHGFLPARHVDHMHPNAIIAIAATRRGRELTGKVFGQEVGWVDWLRPGFELGLKMRLEVERQPNLIGFVMGQHGLINWADDDRECYERTLSLIERAASFIAEHDRGGETFGGQKYPSLAAEERMEVLTAILPWLRGQVSQLARQVATVDDEAATLQFVNSHDAVRLAALGTSCPDHFLRTKIRPLFVDWQPQRSDVDGLQQQLQAGLHQYRREYAAYYQRCRRADSPAMRDPNPTVVLIPGLGMIAWGKNKSESRVTAEFYKCAIEVMRGAEAIDEYIALPEQEAFDIEYWSLEEAKLRRMPAEKPLARRIVLVVGAGSGIGRAVARRVAAEGAHVVCADLDGESARGTADELTRLHGTGIGVAGSGISAAGPAIGVAVNITSRPSIRALLRDCLLAYGGLDSVIVTAGVFPPPDRRGRNSDDQWRQAFDVNVTGAHLMVDEARAILERQGLTASIVLTTSVNGVVAKAGSLAYDTSKAAANHLVRELAIELAPLVRVNAVAPATVVEGSTMFPRDRVIASLTKYQIPFQETDADEELRRKLAAFYAQRTLLKTPITAEDQAEAACFLISERSARTTGQILSVDGGLAEAFLR